MREEIEQAALAAADPLLAEMNEENRNGIPRGGSGVPDGPPGHQASPFLGRRIGNLPRRSINISGG